MTHTPATLEDLLDEVPSELRDYFTRIADGSLSGHDEFEVNLLSMAEAVRWTNDFRSFHPLVQVLRGVILDDPNTSNHHMYVSMPPCKGAVLFIDHDGASRIVFPTLAAFLDTARRSVSDRRELSSFHPEGGVLLADQDGLNQFIADQFDGNQDGGPDVILALMKASDLNCVGLLQRMAKCDDCYVAEAVGEAIARRPRPELRPVALTCREHPHFQAAEAGERAMAAIAALQ